MSGTRTAEPGQPFRQERYASSSEYDRGFLANLVARRCQCAESKELRETIWFIQRISHELGPTQSAAALVPILAEAKCYLAEFPDRISEALAQLCLDPALTVHGSHLNAVLNAARTLMKSRVETSSGRFVKTVIGERVFGALDYTLKSRGMSIIDGRARIGKTFAAKAWCEQHPGVARYVQVPACNDDIGFFRAIARAIGVSTSLSYKLSQLRDRVCDALQPGDLMLVMDEAHGLWPQSTYRDAMPKRVTWIMVELINFGVPVALVTTPQFIRSQRAVERKTAWTSDQFIGRISHYEKLPEELHDSDLAAVARAQLSTDDQRAIKALVLYAKGSAKYVAGIETAVSRAKYLAEKSGRTTVTFGDVKTAISESIIPSDSALFEALHGKNKNDRKMAAPSREADASIHSQPQNDEKNRVFGSCATDLQSLCNDVEDLNRGVAIEI